MEPLQERTCERCGLIQLFEVGYEPRDWDVGIGGGWWAALLVIVPDDVDPVEGWAIAERCRCALTDVAREALEMEVAKDFGIGWEPAGLP